MEDTKEIWEALKEGGHFSAFQSYEEWEKSKYPEKIEEQKNE